MEVEKRLANNPGKEQIGVTTTQKRSDKMRSCLVCGSEDPFARRPNAEAEGK